MLLYNITIAIDTPVETEWTHWMKQAIIPQLMATGIFREYRFYKVLTHDDPASASYCLQYFVDNIELVNRYLKDHAPEFLNHLRERYPDRHAVFQTLLEEVN
ncbi:MAG: DUF4286 family protein [Bacteroidota bacterium]